MLRVKHDRLCEYTYYERMILQSMFILATRCLGLFSVLSTPFLRVEKHFIEVASFGDKIVETTLPDSNF